MESKRQLRDANLDANILTKEMIQDKQRLEEAKKELKFKEKKAEYMKTYRLKNREKIQNLVSVIKNSDNLSGIRAKDLIEFRDDPGRWRLEEKQPGLLPEQKLTSDLARSEVSLWKKYTVRRRADV